MRRQAELGDPFLHRAPQHAFSLQVVSQHRKRGLDAARDQDSCRLDELPDPLHLRDLARKGNDRRVVWQVQRPSKSEPGIVGEPRLAE